MKRVLKKIIKNIIIEYNYLRISPKPIIFDHIPKCAGSSVNEYLYRYYPSRYIYRAGASIDKVNKFKKLPTKEKEKYKYINGHFANLLIKEVGNEVKTVVIFREPIDRIVSHYYYIKRKKNHHLHKLVFIERNISLKDYCSLVDSIELRNFYVRRYSGLSIEEIQESPEKAVALAFKNVTSNYDLVGFQDNIDEFMDRLSKEIDVPNSHKKDVVINKTKNRKKLQEIGKETIEAIQSHNVLDIQFYQKLRESFAQPFNSMSTHE